MRELLIGCGSRRDKMLFVQGKTLWENLTTLDINKAHKPDVVWDLNERPLPFDADTFDEIHAYEVLEHLGKGVGDYRSWFKEWSEWWRLLKPGGTLCGSSPSLTSPWLFGDPSHCRVVSRQAMYFLHQPAYAEIGKTPMSDFRYLYKADFDFEHLDDSGPVFTYVLKAIKPARIIET